MVTAARVMRMAPQQPAAGGLEPRRLALGFALVAGSLCALALLLPITYALLIAAPVLAVWFWRSPIRGVYVLMAGAVLIEIFPLHFADSLTDRIPLFLNLNNTAGFDFPITPAEVLMLTAAGVAFAKAASEGNVRWPQGRLVAAYTIYIAVVLGSEVHGMLAGGDFKTSLWEIRPQVYGFVLFFLTTTLLVNRRQLEVLAVVFLLAASTKAFIGDYRYFFTLQRTLGTQLQVLAHEDSYFLGIFIAAGIAALIWVRDRRTLLLIGLVTPLGLIAMLANSRRAGAYALASGVVLILILGYKFEPALRKYIAVAAAILLIAATAFITYNWDKQYGIGAQLVRPVRSLIDPSTRDFLSDQYRAAENANLKLTFQTSPIIGVGFGSPYLTAYPMADISRIYALWNVIPHNSLMWVGMRMGAIGFATFWALIGMVFLEGFTVLRDRRDPLLRAVAAVVLAATVAEILVGYADLQLESYRNLIFLGVALGVLNRLSQLPEVGHV